MNQEALTKNDKDLLKGLRVCKLKAQLGNTQSVLEKKEKLRALIVNSTFLRRISPAILGFGLV